MRGAQVTRWVGVIAVACALAAASQAQQDDHLKCYKIKDPLKLKGIVDIDTAQFGLEAGCKISKAKLFCVPATKTALQAFDKRAPIDPLPIFGPPAPGDRLCYKIRCEKPFPADTPQVSDQFGTRTIEKFKPTLLCTPAFKGVPPPVPCGNSEFPTCDGDCPDTGQVCEPAGDGLERCVCKTPSTPCGLQVDGTCSGDCLLSTQVCQHDSVTGKCVCVTSCGKQADSTCGGDCTAGTDICQPVPGIDACACGPVTAPCAMQTDGKCAGDCPPGEICQYDPSTNDCGCGPVSQKCEDTQNPNCAGPCPPGEVCRQWDGSDWCRCQPEPCGKQADGSCGGACPAGQACLPLGPDCVCTSFNPACADTAPACDGSCPAGQICTPLGPDCVCTSFNPACADTAPACDGSCPAGQSCTPVGPDCVCQ